MTAVGFQLKDRVLLGLSVDGKDLPINMNNILELQVTENVQNRLPAFRLIYKDQTAFLHDTAPISDGSKMGIILHSGIPSDPESPQDMIFNINGAGNKPEGSCLNYRIAGVLDHIKYLSAIAKMPMNDTSSGAIGQIAKQCGLKFEGLGTSDKMPWLPPSQTTKFSDFVSHICLHGKSGSKSVMSTGVTDTGILKYKDLSKLIGQSGGRRIVHASSQSLAGAAIPYVTWEVISINGFGNLTQGAGMETIQEKMTGGFDISDLVNAIFGGDSLNLSKSLAGILGGAVLKEFAPTDMKNQAEGFYKAKNQNMRGTSLFTNVVEVLTTQATGLHIYDTVYFEPILPQTNKIASLYAGNYIVSARTRFLQKKNYWEKIRLQSNSGGAGGKGQQGGS